LINTGERENGISLLLLLISAPAFRSARVCDYTGAPEIIHSDYP